MAAQNSGNRNDRHRTKKVSPDWMKDVAVAGIDGMPLDGPSGQAFTFDPEECAFRKSARLAERCELRQLLLDWLGDDRLTSMMDLYVHLSLRQLSPGNPCSAYRLQAKERPSLQHLILLAASGCEYGLAVPLQRALDLSRAEIMAASTIAACLRGSWALVSPRTARVLPAVDAWAVRLGEQQQFASLSEDQVSDYVVGNADILLTEQDAYLSVTQCNNLFVLCVVRLHPCRDGACCFARSIGQEIILGVGKRGIVEMPL